MAVVFSDAFNVASTTPLEEYPSVGSPDYVAIFGGNSLSIDPTQDAVYPESQSADFLYRVTDASAPTGDQEVTLITTVQGTGYTQMYVLARASGSNPTGSSYSLQRSGPTTWQLWRMNGGVWGVETGGGPLTTFTVTAITAPATVVVKLKVTGTNPVVITATINGVQQTPYNDSHANRLTTGTPGIAGWIETGDATPYGTLLLADDLTTPSTFGDTTPGASSFPTSNDRAIVRAFTLSENANLKAMTLYFDGSSTVGSFHKGLIYDESGGLPNALVAVTEPGYLPPGGTSLVVPVTGSLSPGTFFAGGVADDFAARWTADSGVGGYRKEGTTYASPAGTFGASPPTTTDGVSVLIEYVAGASSTNLLVNDAFHGHEGHTVLLPPPPSAYKVRFPEATPRGGADVWDQGAAGQIITTEFFGTTSGSGTPLTLQDTAHAHVADAPVLTTEWALTVADGSHAHTVDQVALATQISIAVADALHAHTADGTVLSLGVSIAPDDALHGHTADSLALTTLVSIAVQDAVHAHAADALVLTSDTAISVQDATHGHTVDTLLLSQAILLAVQDALHAHASDATVLTVGVQIAPQDATHAQTADVVTLTVLVGLTVNNSTHAHTADTLVLTSNIALTLADAVHAHTADSVVLGAQVALAVQEALHAQTAESVVLSLERVLGVDDTAHAHTADNLALTSLMSLLVADSAHGHTADSVQLSTQILLTLADASHAHSADTVELATGLLMQVQDAVHAQSSEAVQLVFGQSLEPQDAAHDHSAEAVELVLGIGLTVDRALHAHLADAVVLVLQGELIVDKVTGVVLAGTVIAVTSAGASYSVSLAGATIQAQLVPRVITVTQV